MPSAHATLFPDDCDVLARYRREYEQDQDELNRQRRQEERERQRTQQVAAADSWTEIDRRIDAQCNIVTEIAGEASGRVRRDFQEALSRRDEKIKSLQRQVRALHDEVDLRLKLADELVAAREEIAALRARAPDYVAELKGLKETSERQERLIVRLRSESSQVQFGLRKLETEQQKSRTELKMTSIEISNIGGATRTALEALRQEGFIEDWSPRGPPS